MADWRETSFGRMRTLPFGDTEVELLEFDQPGRNHTHDRWEHAACLEGDGGIEVNGEGWVVFPGEIITVPPGTPHRMIPYSDDTYRWLLWYSDVPDWTVEGVARTRSEADGGEG